jgi:hypothetical protein
MTQPRALCQCTAGKAAGMLRRASAAEAAGVALPQEAYGYTLLVVPNGAQSFVMNPYISIVFGVTVSLFVCLCLAVCRRAYARRNRR